MITLPLSNYHHNILMCGFQAVYAPHNNYQKYSMFLINVILTPMSTAYTLEWWECGTLCNTVISTPSLLSFQAALCQLHPKRQMPLLSHRSTQECADRFSNAFTGEIDRLQHLIWHCGSCNFNWKIGSMSTSNRDCSPMDAILPMQP